MLLPALIFALTLPAQPVPTPEATCPISGKKANPNVSVFHEGKSVAFCCANCRKSFRSKNENTLTEAQKKEGWTLVFDGKTLNGFQEPTRDGKWQVKDGALYGTGGPGVLATQAGYDHFVWQADIRVSDTGTRRGNSGVFIRSTGLKAFRGRWPDGPEIQVDHGDPNFWTGAVWKKAKAKKVTTKDGDWFQMKIVAQGPTIRVFVNGAEVTTYKAEGAVVKGPIALQCHHPTDVVEFKNVKVRSLEKA